MNARKRSKRSNARRRNEPDPDPGQSADKRLAENNGERRDAAHGAGPKEKLGYMRQMLIEIRKMSESIDQKTVAYLLDMAVLELDESLDVLKFDQELKN